MTLRSTEFASLPLPLAQTIGNANCNESHHEPHHTHLKPASPYMKAITKPTTTKHWSSFSLRLSFLLSPLMLVAMSCGGGHCGGLRNNDEVRQWRWSMRPE